MGNFILCCGSTADLTKEKFASRNIEYICFSYTLGGKELKDDLGQSLSFKDFYNAMRSGQETKTAQINTDEYIRYFTPFLEQGNDLLYVSLSSGLSGTYSCAVLAADELKAKFPDRKIRIVDSLGASSGYGLLMDTLADLRDGGADIDTVADFAEEKRLNMHHWFYSTDLTFYIKGGRVSKAAGWFGTVLKICPLLNMDFEGHLIPRKKLKGKKRAMLEALNQMKIHAEGGLGYNKKCFISHSDCPEEARELASLVEQTFPNLKSNVEIYYIGTTIGSHSGPGTVALYFWGDKRND